MKLLLENWRRFLNEGKKVKIFRAQPASTKVIRNNDYVTMSRKFARDHAVTSAIYNDEPFFVVVAFVEEDKIKEADNPGEYRYTGDGIQAMPLDIVDAEGNIGSAAKHRVNEGKFKHKGSSDYFRVELPGIGYAEGGEHLRLKECQADVDALMQTPEYLAAEEKQVANAKPRTTIVKDEETDKWVAKEIGPATFRPRFYDINNAWIHNEKNRGKGYGKEIYKAFIEQAIEYSKSYGGVFIGAHHCTIGSGTSDEAKRVWKSLAKEYTSSGDVVFIGL